MNKEQCGALFNMKALRVYPVHTCLTARTAAEGRDVAERGWSDTVLLCRVPGMDRSDAANEFMRATEPFSAYFSAGDKRGDAATLFTRLYSTE